MEFTQHEKHKHQAVFPTQATGKVPVLVFMLLKVLRLSSQRRCVIDGSEEQATTQTGGMSAQTGTCIPVLRLKPSRVELISREGHLQITVMCTEDKLIQVVSYYCFFFGGGNLILLCLSNKGVFPSPTVNTLLNAAANDCKGLTLRIWQHASQCPVIWARPIYCLKKGKSQSELNVRMFTTARINCDCDS